MILNYNEIHALVHEIRQKMVPSIVNKIRKGFQKEILLELYWNGKKEILVIAFQPWMTTLHLASKEQTFPFSADRFTMFLRKYFQRKKILDIIAVPGERIVQIVFENAPLLVLHLFPKGGNILVVNPVDRKIMGSFSPADEKIYQELEPVPGETQKNIPEIDLTEHAKTYEKHLKKHLFDTLVREHQSRIKKEMQRLKKKLSKMEKDYENCLKADKYSEYGNIIMAYHGNDKRRGETSLDTVDFEGNTIAIPLKPQLSVRDNGQKFFERARKLKKAQPILEERILETQERIEELQQEREIKEDWTLEELKEFFRKRRKQAKAKTPYVRELLVLENPEGYRFYVGRNSDENDLIYKMARGRDYWFHNRDYPGSHVLIPVEKKDRPDEKTIVQAAHLAVLYSKSRKHGEGYVMMSRRKFLNRSPGMAKGQVSVHRYRSIFVKLNDENLKSLKRVKE
jgi:predicted ribosome quality control (RQC) complex YloA/Tae2 family protein